MDKEIVVDIIIEAGNDLNEDEYSQVATRRILIGSSQVLTPRVIPSILKSKRIDNVEMG